MARERNTCVLHTVIFNVCLLYYLQLLLIYLVVSTASNWWVLCQFFLLGVSLQVPTITIEIKSSRSCKFRYLFTKVHKLYGRKRRWNKSGHSILHSKGFQRFSHRKWTAKGTVLKVHRSCYQNDLCSRISDKMIYAVEFLTDLHNTFLLTK